MSGGGDNFDFCEYVYNPLMRQYQAMIRLMQMLRDGGSQSDCNDIQCFTDSNDPTNPMTSLNNVSSSSMFTYLPVILVWAVFLFALFMFRPNSMRNSQNRDNEKLDRNKNNNSVNNFNRRNDGDDDSTIS